MPSDNVAAIYGLNIPATGERVPATMLEFPVRIHISMAAIDPTSPPKRNGNEELPAKTLATLKIIRVEVDSDDEDEDDDDDEDQYLRALLDASDDEDDSEEDSDDEPNGGPSDKTKAMSKKQKRAEAMAELMKAAKAEAEDEEDEEMEDAKPNGTKSSKKGKEKATGEEEDDEEDSDDDEDDEFDFGDAEEFVLCTLDTERTYQQPLDITINENEIVFFQVTGNHDITLTGNYIDTDEPDSEDDDGDYDLDPEHERMILGEDSDEEGAEDSDESDELDDVDGPRVTELDSDDEDEEAPKLVEAPAKKGKNKRPAEDEAEGLDEMIAKDEKKLSKKQLKKLKNNKGEAVASEEPKAAATKKDAKNDKKVQFAKELEQGPTGSASKEKAGAKGVKVVQGVTIDDRTIGSGRAVKNGDTVGMRYIGKLKNGKQFDANKKGRPFYFKVGKGEVIKGWDVGIVGMQIGGERRLTLPPNMGYGAKGAGPDIPGNSTLIFDVKLLEIK